MIHGYQPPFSDITMHAFKHIRHFPPRTRYIVFGRCHTLLCICVRFDYSYLTKQRVLEDSLRPKSSAGIEEVMTRKRDEIAG